VARSGIVAQTAPQQATPIKEGSASLPAETTAPVQANGVDAASVNSSAASNPAQAPADNGSADTNVASQPESSTVASSAIPQAPPAAAASASFADPLAASPVTVAQSAPAAVAQPASPAPAVRPAPVVNRAAAPKWIGGGLVKADNPRGRYRGTVTVRFTVRPDGRVSGCRPAVSSGSAALDARTCQLVEERLRFRPALDWEGRAIPYETRAIYTWGVKHHSLLDQLLHPGRR
jgi:periplasmic protein TonB